MGVVGVGGRRHGPPPRPTTAPGRAGAGRKELLQSHEQDRRLIAHEIHDGLVQEATAAQMRLEALLPSGQVTPGPLRQELELVLGLVRNTIRRPGSLSWGCGRPCWRSGGWSRPSASWSPVSRPADRRSNWRSPSSLSRLEPLLETAIYRIVQEALSNVRRHSRSDRAEVRITQLGDRVEVEIRDWGVGFDPASVGQDSVLA